MANIRDVARKAGVSVATVSNVLNRSRKVRSGTAERVMQAARELNYSRSVAARDLAVGHSRILGLVISDIQNPFFPEVIRGFQDQALAHEMDTLVMNTSYDPHRTLTFVNRLLALRVPGVAVLTSEIDPVVYQMLRERRVCTVSLDHGKVELFSSNIVVDYAGGIQEALEHLKQLGHEQIGFIGGNPDVRSAQIRKRAFLDNVGSMAAGHPHVIDADFTVKGGYFACSKLLARGGPTAVIAANDLMALGAVHCAYDRGIKIPAELSIVGFDDIAFSEVTQPPLTTVAVPRRRIGEAAFQALVEMMTAEPPEGREFQIATRLIVRESTARAPITG